MIRWTDITPSEFPHEQRALEFLKTHMPEREPYRAWGPFQFESDGSFSEVDCLVIASAAIFLVEIKNWHGEIREAPDGKWSVMSPEGRIKNYDNALAGANYKARKLKGRLQKSRAFKKKRLPWVQAAVFFSNPDFGCLLPADKRSWIGGLGTNEDGSPRQGGGLSGIVEVIEGFAANPPDGYHGTHKIDAATSASIVDSVGQIGITPSDKYRQIGVVEIGEPISEDKESREFAGHHHDKANLPYRITFHKAIRKSIDDDGVARARRAAAREFDLLAPHDTRHPGLAAAFDIDLEHPWGPAVVYAGATDSMHLDAFLEAHNETLSLDARTSLLRRIIVAVQYAHARGMFHRALRPRVVLVHKTPAGIFQPVVTGWHHGLRSETDDTGLTAVPGTSLTASGDPELRRYRAPEADTVQSPDPRLLDVFSLGALAYLIYSGLPPPSDPYEALEASGGSLDPREVNPDVDEDAAAFVTLATAADASQRADSVDDLLLLLEPIEKQVGQEPAEALTRRESKPDGSLSIEDLRVGTTVGRFKILQRLSQGSTAIALKVVRNDGIEGVLKVASDESSDARVAAEAEVLGVLRSDSVVNLLQGPLEIAGRTALFLEEADQGTLRQRLRSHGALTEDDFYNLGEGLLDALSALERQGVFHRDIKPENIGLVTSKGIPATHLLLLDFSLTAAPATELQIGTVPYLDPFLGLGDRDFYDHAADRYAAAVVLHELITHTPPHWGDGSVNPRYSSCDLVLATESFPARADDSLTEFFTRAMTKNVEERYEDTRAMVRAWRRIWDNDEVRPSPLARAEDATDGSVSPSSLGEGSGAPVSEPRPPGPELVDLGIFHLDPNPTEESFRGNTPSREQDVSGIRRTFTITGPASLTLEVADEQFDNGERQIRLKELPEMAPRFSRLTNGCRLGVYSDDAVIQMELRQARMTEGDWSTMRNATEIELSNGSSTDFTTALCALGAERIGTRAELLGDLSPRRNALFAIAPVGRDLVPVAAYVMTRVAPVYQRL